MGKTVVGVCAGIRVGVIEGRTATVADGSAVGVEREVQAESRVNPKIRKSFFMVHFLHKGFAKLITKILLPKPWKLPVLSIDA